PSLLDSETVFSFLSIRVLLIRFSSIHRSGLLLVSLQLGPHSVAHHLPAPLEISTGQLALIWCLNPESRFFFIEAGHPHHLFDPHRLRLLTLVCFGSHIFVNSRIRYFPNHLVFLPLLLLLL
ncbi:hypothetical protein PFISCL1PPCAC_18160, partial [Pristionchus fissidentatus]